MSVTPTPSVRIQHAPLVRSASDPEVSTIAEWRTLSGRTVLAACRRRGEEYRQSVQAIGNIGVGRMWVEIRLPSGEWAEVPTPEWIESTRDAALEIEATQWRAAHPAAARAALAYSDAEWDHLARRTGATV